VPGVFLDHVHENPAQRDASLAAPRGMSLAEGLSLPSRQLLSQLKSILEKP